MADEKKTPPPSPTWKHNHELSFKGIHSMLSVVKEKLEETLKVQKSELARMVGARDNLRK